MNIEFIIITFTVWRIGNLIVPAGRVCGVTRVGPIVGALGFDIDIAAAIRLRICGGGLVVVIRLLVIIWDGVSADGFEGRF